MRFATLASDGGNGNLSHNTALRSFRNDAYPSNAPSFSFTSFFTASAVRMIELA
jgi:hypothetical protein